MKEPTSATSSRLRDVKFSTFKMFAHPEASTHRRGTTLFQIVLTAVLMMILLTIGIPLLQRQMEHGRASLCAENISRIHRALYMYRGDNEGWWPIRQIQTPAGLLRDSNPWIEPLTDKQYVTDVQTFCCPSDPNAPRRRDSATEFFRNQVTVAPSYGLNLLTWRDYYCSPTDHPEFRRQPSRPECTILLADRGPDLDPNRFSETSSPRQETIARFRDNGTLPAADGFRMGMVTSPPSWLSGRHNGCINLMTIGGSATVQHDVRKIAGRSVEPYYDDCAAGNCTFCNVFKAAHYDFSASQLYWWTGPYPRSPNASNGESEAPNGSNPNQKP